MALPARAGSAGVFDGRRDRIVDRSVGGRRSQRVCRVNLRYRLPAAETGGSRHGREVVDFRGPLRVIVTRCRRRADVAKTVGAAVPGRHGANVQRGGRPSVDP